MTAAPASIGGPIRVFISYSHDSREHVERVLILVNRLRSQGIDCHLDQYEVSPPEGWPSWMNSQISAARFVLVICTATYARRVAGYEQPGRGLGAQWEGAIITQSLYENGGRNEKFIPVIFETSDLAFVPIFLRPITRYDLSSASGYEELYRHLTNQPRVIRPPLGPVSVLPPVEPLPHEPLQTPSTHEPERVLLMSFEGDGTFFIPLLEVNTTEAVVLAVRPGSAQQTAFLERLNRQRRPQVGVAFGLSAFLGRLSGVIRHYEAAQDAWRLTFAPESNDYGAGFMEMSTTGYSADDIATLRARRILLNEQRLLNSSDELRLLNDTTLEVLIRGMNTPLQVTSSPLPGLFADVGNDPNAFVVAARLLLTLYLRLSGVVENVLRLDLEFAAPASLHVDFEGERAKKYTNVSASRVAVRGVCLLDETRPANSR